MITIKYAGGHFAAARADHARILIFTYARPGRIAHTAWHGNEETARRWLCDRGLRKSRAKQLLAAALRKEGPLAEPSHKSRIADVARIGGERYELPATACRQ